MFPLGRHTAITFNIGTSKNRRELFALYHQKVKEKRSGDNCSGKVTIRPKGIANGTYVFVSTKNYIYF